MSSLVKITDLKRWRNDVRWRKRRWVLEKGLSFRKTRVVIASVVLSNSNDHTPRGKGLDSACDWRGRRGEGFPSDGLNLGSDSLLAG